MDLEYSIDIIEEVLKQRIFDNAYLSYNINYNLISMSLIDKECYMNFNDYLKEIGLIKKDKIDKVEVKKEAEQCLNLLQQRELNLEDIY